MLNWPAISLLLQPWTSKSSTYGSRGVTSTLSRSITVVSSWFPLFDFFLFDFFYICDYVRIAD